MNLQELKCIFDKIDDDAILDYGIDDVFSSRGSYDEVAFSIGRNVPAIKSKYLILKAYTETFTGYKGGDYQYGDFTPVNFERSICSFSDGEYREEKISEILGESVNSDRDKYLAEIMASALRAGEMGE